MSMDPPTKLAAELLGQSLSIPLAKQRLSYDESHLNEKLTNLLSGSTILPEELATLETVNDSITDSLSPAIKNLQLNKQRLVDSILTPYDNCIQFHTLLKRITATNKLLRALIYWNDIFDLTTVDGILICKEALIDLPILLSLSQISRQKIELDNAENKLKVDLQNKIEKLIKSSNNVNVNINDDISCIWDYSKLVNNKQQVVDDVFKKIVNLQVNSIAESFSNPTKLIKVISQVVNVQNLLLKLDGKQMVEQFWKDWSVAVGEKLKITLAKGGVIGRKLKDVFPQIKQIVETWPLEGQVKVIVVNVWK
ncbi:hypothetical protein DAMA08_023320 [Martiniozyma asiatica (nom. inval.)]|nr:hypothetical protein DAMA08_023320 [Martiniozyma asiatica]